MHSRTGRYGSLLKNGSLGPGMHANGDQDNSLWMMANPNWATLSIWRGGDPHQAIDVADKSLDWWRSHLNDMWNVVAVGGGLASVDRGGQPSEGQPLANSHYGYHMVMWHIPFALSGQHWDASTLTLTFKPKLSAPFSLPVLVPGTSALLVGDEGGGGSLEILAGQTLTLKQMRVGNRNSSHLPRTLKVGDSIKW